MISGLSAEFTKEQHVPGLNLVPSRHCVGTEGQNFWPAGIMTPFGHTVCASAG